MEDVIFAGTNSRPALGRAEVSLTIDNGSGKLPVDMAEVTITRTLFRSGDSEYAINGTACRLLDIQELLSDSGVGRQQHMIIGQGQLDAVLNARPEERRGIIEEAAGVLKHRRRRERAERRLAATQENLERLGDLVREVRRQIRPLERQAAAARSHAAMADELRTIRRYLAGQELRELGTRRQTAAAGLTALAAEETELQRAVVALDEAAAATAAELSSRREEDLASALGRVQGLVERTRGTAGVLRERSRSLAAALDAAADVDVVSTLEAEGARLADELAEATAEATALEPERDTLDRTTSALADDERRHAETWGDGADQPAAADALTAARGRIELRRRALEQDRRNLDGLDRRIVTVDERIASLDRSADDLATTATELEAEAVRLGGEAETADDAQQDAVRRAETAERTAHVAEQQRHRTAARAEALARALQELEGAGGRELLAGVDGVVGSLVDLVEIDAGWEAAFEAAAGASVAAVVVDGREAVRVALARLHEQGATGALLAARAATGARGPADTRVLGVDAGSLPAGAEPVRPHIRLRSGTGAPGVGAAGVGGVLDALVGQAVRVADWERAVDLALDRPDLVVVTGHGDRFADSGWRVRSTTGVVTAAAVEEAQHRAQEAAVQADRAAGELAEARSGPRSGPRRRRHRGPGRRPSRGRPGGRRHRPVAFGPGAGTDRRRAGGRPTGPGRVGDPGRDRPGRAGRAGGGTARPGGGRGRGDRAGGRGRGRVGGAAGPPGASSSRRSGGLEVRSAGLDERRRVLTQRHAEVERRLEGHAEEREAAAARRQRLEADGVALERLGRLVDAEREKLEGVLETLRTDYRHQVEAVRAGGERLESLRRDRAAADGRLVEVRERGPSARPGGGRGQPAHRGPDRAGPAGSWTATRPTSSTCRRPSCPTTSPPPTAPRRWPASWRRSARSTRSPSTSCRCSRSGTGSSRPQTDDIRSARRELQEVIRTLDDDIMQSFAAAAADVNEHFSTLVAMLFPGGTGRLSLTEPDDLLHTGVEIEVRPAGRNVRRVSLLSGGERSLAALAFLFAVFRSRPSPFYLMDEVEAALDDVNLHRFLGLVREFRDEAQLIIVSHQKRTMETGDALYGVTMAPGGSSQVLSQKVAKEPEGASS